MCYQKWLDCTILTLFLCMYFSAVFHQRSVTWWWVRRPPSASLPSPRGPQSEVSATHINTHKHTHRCHSHLQSPDAALVLCEHVNHNHCKVAESVLLYSEGSLTKQTTVFTLPRSLISCSNDYKTPVCLSQALCFCWLLDTDPKHLFLLCTLICFVMFHDWIMSFSQRIFVVNRQKKIMWI